MTFYDLKRALHFPRMAGVLQTKQDVKWLYDLLMSEREQSADAFKTAQKWLIVANQDGAAQRIAADAKMIDQCYKEDLHICRAYMLQEGIKFI
jgi:Ribonuclease G/E